MSAALFAPSDCTAASHRADLARARVCHARRPACGACGFRPAVPVVRGAATDDETARKLVNTDRSALPLPWPCGPQRPILRPPFTPSSPTSSSLTPHAPRAAVSRRTRPWMVRSSAPRNHVTRVVRRRRERVDAGPSMGDRPGLLPPTPIALVRPARVFRLALRHSRMLHAPSALSGPRRAEPPATFPVAMLCRSSAPLRSTRLGPSAASRLRKVPRSPYGQVTLARWRWVVDPEQLPPGVEDRAARGAGQEQGHFARELPSDNAGPRGPLNVLSTGDRIPCSRASLSPPGL